MWDRNDTKSSSERRGDRGGLDEGKKRHDDRRRDRSRSRDRSIRDRHRSRRDDHPPRSDRHRSRSRSPKRNRSRSRSPKRNNNLTRSPPRKPQGDRFKQPLKSSTNNPTPKSNATPSQPSSRPPTTSSTNGTTKGDTEKMDVVNDEEDEEAAAEREMQKIMGFGKFKSTKNTKVPGNDIYAVRKEKKTEYRQYMNRVGGFNRPLSPSRD
ncbi:MAG: hypothetical protein M1835_003476 [Candelina submexicana]|nr:MAG: hypothetical protein M1835_003476 [Candelina submexicana]